MHIHRKFGLKSSVSDLRFLLLKPSAAFLSIQLPSLESEQQILSTTWYSQVHISHASAHFLRKSENFAFSRGVGEAEISTILADF